MPRRAIPACEKQLVKEVENHLKEKVTTNTSVVEQKETHKNINIYIPIVKANDEKQTMTGVVLQPEVTDAQGDIMSSEVIEKAAHNFLAKYNKATQLGLQHKYFGKYKFELYESWLAPQDITINGIFVRQGSWVMTVRVDDKEIWQMVKDGKLTGFSIGGRARVQKLENNNE